MADEHISRPPVTLPLMGNNGADYTKPTPREKTLLALLKGVEEKFPEGEVLRVDGVPHTKAQLRQRILDALAPEQAHRHAHIDLKMKVAVKDKNKRAVDRLYKFAKWALINYYGENDAESLSGYGIAAPRERRKATAAEKVVTAARSAETKKARGTDGKIQRKR